MKLSDEHRKRLEKVMPANAKIPDDPDNEYWLKLVESRSDEHKTAMSRITALESEVNEAKRGLELARGNQPKQMDPDMLIERRKRLSAACDHSLGLKFSKPCLDALKDFVLGTDASPNVMMLSRENPDNVASTIRAEKLIEILGTNVAPPPVGTQSGIQLSRQVSGQQSTEEQKKQEEAWEAEGKAYRQAEYDARGITIPK